MVTTARDVQAASARQAHLNRRLVTQRATEREIQARKDLAREQVVRTKAQRMISDGLALLESLDHKPEASA